ncbi:MAG: hypothetical protein PHQ53_03115, partial [Candidatus Krumholzibacteria bacterium]|nr:hypothetical protein [Candidatus Krumholzibacteria bacterium]
MHCRFAVYLLVLFAASPLVGRTQDTPAAYSIADFLQTATFSAVAVSPDGAQIAWVRTSRDLDADKRWNELWLGDANGTWARRFTWSN